MIRMFMLLIMLGLPVFISGCAQFDARGPETVMVGGDDALVLDVARRLESDPVTARLRLGIQSNDGIITMTGRIDNAAERARAVAIARGVTGVRGVIDQTVRF